VIRAGAFLLALAAPLAQPLAAQAVAPVSSTFQPAATLQQDLDRIAAVEAGRVGIAVIDLKSDAIVSTNADERFPMASVVKIAVAALYLAEVDAGRRSLGKMIALDERIRVGSEGIAQLMPHAGVTLSAANLIELMLRVSDNSATDMLVDDLGGTAKVQAWLDRHRVAGMRMDRTIAQLVLDNLGLKTLPGKTAAQSLWASPPPTYESKQAAAPAFDADPRDTATPMGAARLLARIARGDMLSTKSRSFLFDVMSRVETGSDRLKAGLPEGASLLHKTGTLTNISNDVGIIALKDGRQFAVAVFTRGIEDGRIRARIAADTARAIAAH
jgi:beta-lactamase class A